MANVADSNDLIASPDGQGSRLTVQERDILALSATGWRTVAVAEALGLTPEVVRRSLASTITRLGARSKIEAVMIAVRNGLIDLPTEPGRWLRIIAPPSPMVPRHSYGAPERASVREVAS
jgi:DNA-binding CsgD family transcriptional regulator